MIQVETEESGDIQEDVPAVVESISVQDLALLKTLVSDNVLWLPAWVIHRTRIRKIPYAFPGVRTCRAVP